ITSKDKDEVMSGLPPAVDTRKLGSTKSGIIDTIIMTGTRTSPDGRESDKKQLKSVDKNKIAPVNMFPMGSSASTIKSYKSGNMFESIMKNLMGMPDKQEEEDIDVGANDDFVLDENKTYELLDMKIETLDDLIKLGRMYDPLTASKYAVDLKKLNHLIEPLTELKNVVGMHSVKKDIVNKIIYFLQSFEKNDNMLHTIVQGPPGVGKTMLGVILGNIYYALGVLKGTKNAINELTGKKNKFVFKIVRRTDLIGEFLGHTAVKTQRVIDECKGGVLFIDEAYSLGTPDKRDSYSKECIDVLNQNLSENKNKFLCIIAGYPDELEKCFFSHNEGLRRRFPFTYSIEKYSSAELTNILVKKIDDCKWKLDGKLVDDKKDSHHKSGSKETLQMFIETNALSFKHFGGDIETLLFNSKIVHAVRVFGKHPRERKILTLDDIKGGFDMFIKNGGKKTDINEEKYSFIYA
ncbi:MAG: AAA family ATPase, partial [Faunusvirus sp.]